MAYITASDYSLLTGRDSDEATIIRITKACKLLDARIGNYPVLTSGYKIDSSNDTWRVALDPGSDLESDIYVNWPYYNLTTGQKDAIKMWVAEMIMFLVQNNDSSPTSDNLKLGRFSVSKNAKKANTLIPEQMYYTDSILVESGIINRRVNVL